MAKVRFETVGGGRYSCPAILIIVGTRPEAIKLVSVVKRLRDHGSFDVVFTGLVGYVEWLGRV